MKTKLNIKFAFVELPGGLPESESTRIVTSVWVNKQEFRKTKQVTTTKESDIPHFKHIASAFGASLIEIGNMIREQATKGKTETIKINNTELNFF